MFVFHGSEYIIKEPMYHGGKFYNDFGNGFYTTESKDKAQSWALLSGNPQKSIVNVYDLDCSNLRVLDLKEYGILSWIAEVVANRGTNQRAAAIVGNRVVDKYRVNSDGYDIIKGYSADDSYSQIIDSFLLNQFTVEEVESLFYKALEEQIFLKSQKAFDNMTWVRSYEVAYDPEMYNADIHARRKVNEFVSFREEQILLEGYKVPGITARYAIQHDLNYCKECKRYELYSI